MTVRALVRPVSVLALGLLLGCPGNTDTGKEPGDTADTATVDTAETGDTGLCPDGSAPVTYYADNDRDTYGDLNSPQEACEKAIGWVVDASDCDDTNGDINPAATEVCNGADDNCDGATDEGLATTWYADADNDGFGDAAAPTSACEQPSGYVADDSDCDDTDNHVNPDADDLCSGEDENCDGVIDLPGTAMYEDPAGVRYDVTAPLAAGTADAPAYIGDQAGYSIEVTSGTVSLCEGTWYAKVVLAGLGSDVTVVGRDGAAKTTLTTHGTAGGDDGSVIAVTGATLTVRGLTITGGIGSEDNTKGGGVAVTQSGAVAFTPNVTFYDTIITGNQTDYGGGLALLDYGSVAMHDSWVTGNVANEVGGGVWVQDHGELTCDVTGLGGGGFTSNSAPIAGGFYFSSKSNGLLDSSGCDWGNAGVDDNSVNDIQRQPYYSNAWCFGNSTAITDLVTCDSTGCSGTQVVSCG